MINSLILIFLLSLVGCNAIGKVKINKAATSAPTAAPTDPLPSFSFIGLDSASDLTDSTVKLNWTPHVDAIGYDVYSVTSGVSTFIDSVSGQAADSIIVTNLIPASTHSFRVRMRSSNGYYDRNTNDVSVTLNSIPTTPGAVGLSYPAVSPSLMKQPIIEVGEVIAGYTVKIYSDSGCTTELVNKVATQSPERLTLPVLADGIYTFYARTTSPAPYLQDSNCSSVYADYELASCPAGYVAVPHNSDLHTTRDFCVAKYEMKNVMGSAISQMALTPWTGITHVAALAACSSLNPADYALITNPEWMTIGHNIEQTSSNWSGVSPVAGQGIIPRGHSDNSATALVASTDNDPYFGTGNSIFQAPTSGWEQKRTYTLSNGEVIWDLSGNVSEYIDWTVTGAQKAYYSADASPMNAWMEHTVLDTNITTGTTMEVQAWQPFFSFMGGNQGMGQYKAGSGSSNATAQRGGSWNRAINAGLYALDLTANNTQNADRGFRCAYHPWGI